MTRVSFALGLAAACVFAAPSSAQLNQQWVSFTKDNSRLAGGSGSVSNSNTEVDLCWGDLDNDGDVDVIAVRKEHFTSTGRRTNQLLMNENGVLVNRASTLANASDVPGDNGFLTPTNDRDAVLADFDGDGWLDVITATTLSDGLSKEIGHPRVYMNLGNDVSGNWLGIKYEASRIPQMVHYGTGNPENPRFCSVAAGDVTGNGLPDLYFGDYDSSGAGGSGQPSNKDMNDRLLINDGNGFFTDESQLRMTTQMLKSAFGNSVIIADFNGDGANDVLKDTSLNAPLFVAISYNNPSNEGFFNIFDDFHNFAPYHTSEGDLNNDGKLDVIITDDGADRFRTNTGNDAFGRVNWSSAQTFSFASGSDDGFGSNNLIVDLDGDGWNDALIADVDVDIGGYGRRLHIYHNRTTSVGDMTPTLREEKQQSGSGGWHGVVGMSRSDLGGTHDVAVFDIDKDGDMDMFISQLQGTFVWTNDEFDPIPCGYTSYGTGAAAANNLVMTGNGNPSLGNTASLTTTGILGSVGFNILSLNQANASLLGGIILVSPGTQIIPMAFLPVVGGSTTWTLPIPNDAALIGFSAYAQSASTDPSQPQGFALSNGVEIVVCP
ncbi:MAG: hypothetical protein ACI9C2_000181 [Gammaproteobacteria bacterium]|jgi:hypothetical protein